PDLRLAREGPAPAWVGRERERVQVRGDVAGAAGVGVVPPGAAEVVGALEHQEVVDAGLAEPDRGAEPAEAAADDRDAQVGRVAHRGTLRDQPALLVDDGSNGPGGQSRASSSRR